MSAPALSLIVSVFDRTEHLKLVLQSLKLQTVASQIEIIVTDNSPNSMHREVAESFGARYLPTKMRECYEAAEYGAAFATGEYLGFPSDDNWYAPEYAERMLRAAMEKSWDLVYCDALFDPRGPSIGDHPVSGIWQGRHFILRGLPIMNHIDKGGFIVRRSLFSSIGGFPGKTGLRCAADGCFVETAAAQCAHGRVPEVMWFHG